MITVHDDQTIFPEQFGAIPDDPTKAVANSEAFYRCSAALPYGGRILLQGRTYYFGIRVNDPANGLKNNAFDIAPHIAFEGVHRRASLLQLVSPSDRYYRAIAVRSGASLRNVTINDDVSNNQQPVNPDNIQCLVYASGMDTSIDNVDLHNSSVWAVGIDDTAHVAPRSDNFTMIGCRSWWHKRASYATPFDVSQVYCKVPSAKLIDNEFYTDAPDFSRTALDLEGTNLTIRGNKAVDYAQPILLGHARVKPDDFGPQAYRIVNNDFTGCRLGIVLFPYALTAEYPMSNLFICGNRIGVDVNRLGAYGDAAGYMIAGVTVNPTTHGTIRNLRITDNILDWVHKEGLLAAPSLVGGIALSNGEAGGYNLDGAIVERNIIRGFPYAGISVGNRPGLTGIHQNISVQGNNLIDNGYFVRAGAGFWRSSIAVSLHALHRLAVQGNLVCDTGKDKPLGDWSFSKSPTSDQYSDVRVEDNTVAAAAAGLRNAFGEDA